MMSKRRNDGVHLKHSKSIKKTYQNPRSVRILILNFPPTSAWSPSVPVDDLQTHALIEYLLLVLIDPGPKTPRMRGVCHHAFLCL